MARYIVKFGGTSVANIDRIKHVADLVARMACEGHQIVVVVSAMAGMTNQLVSYTQSLCPLLTTPEHDVVTASGEQITVGLMALALQQLNLKSTSYLGFQVAIKTDATYTNAKIDHIATHILEESLAQGIIPVVAGFQGISDHNRITTLGRGGSDTTAVALAAALNADRCDIYTDVEGVYTADPRVVFNARKIDTISHVEMLELAAQGAKVLHPRCVELSLRYNINVHVLSSFHLVSGTTIVNEETLVEQTSIRGIAHNLSEAKVTLESIHPITTRMMADLFSTLSREHIAVDMITHTNAGHGLKNALTFIVNKEDSMRVHAKIMELRSIIGFDTLAIDPNIVKISIVGIGIRSNLEITSLVFQTLADHQIDIQMVTTSEIKISLIVAHDHMTKAINVLHDALQLGASTE